MKDNIVSTERSQGRTVGIIVATHKKYTMPSDPMYILLHVGAEGKIDEEGNPLDLGYQKDNTGGFITLDGSISC
jgi:hypothetical protein